MPGTNVYTCVFTKCDGGLLQNARQRPINKRQYENADIFESAADYAFGIAKANTFFDGNKRTAFV